MHKTSQGTIIYGDVRADCKFCQLKKGKDAGFPVCRNPVINWLFEPKHQWVLGCAKPCAGKKKIAETGDIIITSRFIRAAEKEGYIALKSEEWEAFLDELNYIQRWRDSGKKPKHIPSASMVNSFGVERYAVWLLRYCGFEIYNSPELSKKFYIVFERTEQL